MVINKGNKTIGILCLLILLCIGFSACDPAVYGNLYIRNLSNHAVQVHYRAAYESKDSSFSVPALQTLTIMSTYHLGNPKEFSCCPCEFDSIEVTAVDTSLQQYKDPQKSENWLIDKSEVKMWKNHQVDCYFDLNSTDIH